MHEANITRVANEISLFAERHARERKNLDERIANSRSIPPPLPRNNLQRENKHFGGCGIFFLPLVQRSQICKISRKHQFLSVIVSPGEFSCEFTRKLRNGTSSTWTKKAKKFHETVQWFWHIRERVAFKEQKEWNQMDQYQKRAMKQLETVHSEERAELRARASMQKKKLEPKGSTSKLRL